MTFFMYIDYEYNHKSYTKCCMLVVNYIIFHEAENSSLLMISKFNKKIKVQILSLFISLATNLIKY